MSREDEHIGQTLVCCAQVVLREQLLSCWSVGAAIVPEQTLVAVQSSYLCSRLIASRDSSSSATFLSGHS